MANTYSQIHVQIVFAVKNRFSLIKSEDRVEIEKYILGIIKNHNCKLLAIYCNPDHTHIFIGLRPNIMLSELVKVIKTSTTIFIKEKLNKNNYFGWQDGYSAISYSYSQVDAVIKYILNQFEHHKKRSFKEEYINILQKSNIDFDERYLFDFFD
jgi:REP element-mobilizing transposase RayT